MDALCYGVRVVLLQLLQQANQQLFGSAGLQQMVENGQAQRKILVLFLQQNLNQGWQQIPTHRSHYFLILFIQDDTEDLCTVSLLDAGPPSNCEDIMVLSSVAVIREGLTSLDHITELLESHPCCLQEEFSSHSNPASSCMSSDTLLKTTTPPGDSANACFVLPESPYNEIRHRSELNTNSMEVEEKRRSRGSAKTSKKGGKRVKPLTAEEEARRREVLKEKLREKLELEKRALKVVERLLEDSVTEDFLIDCARFITPANYKDAIEERSIAKLCGYPVCPNKLGKIPTQQYKISTKTNKVYDITERKCFCSNFCYKASKEFELQISNTPLWLRQHESPQEIKLMKIGDGGSSGEEVLLSERRLQEKDIEDPLAVQSEDRSQQPSAQADFSHHSESSDNEQEQDFVSSVVSQRQGPRVHWDDLPERTDEDNKGERGRMERRKKHSREGDEEKGHQRCDEEREGKLREDERGTETGTETDAEKPKQLLSLNADKPKGEQVSKEEDFVEDPRVKEAAAKLNLCSLSEAVTHTASQPVDTAATHADLPTSPPCEESNPSTENKHLPSSTLINTNQHSPNVELISQPDLNITQVGMSKRGAAGLRDLLRNHTAGAKPESIRLNLLQCLKRTLTEWSTDETRKFLYGADHPLSSPFTDVEEENVEDKEELDEDDLDDEVTNEKAERVDAGVQKRTSAVPDYEALRKESQQLELRVKEFYKGSWVLPEKGEEQPGNKVTVQHQSMKDPVLPLVDSQAQHLIQKRITVEKLNSCLRNITGPLHLTMSDVSTDLNNLVRTFKFTNTNIIHKTPEWTLIAVVLLHLLSEVSPVVREALEMPASVEYLNTLMEELGLQKQDLLNLTRLFKTPTC